MCESCNQNEAVLTTPVAGRPTGLCLDCVTTLIGFGKARRRDLKKQAKATKRAVKAARHCKCGVVLPSTALSYSRCDACQTDAAAAIRSTTPIYTKTI